MKNYVPLELSDDEDNYSLTMYANYKNKFYKKHGCKCTGYLLEAIARYYIRINKIADEAFDFDSENGMFCVYCKDKEMMEDFARKFQKALIDEMFLKEALYSDEVRDELEQYSSAKKNLLSMLFGKSNPLNTIDFDSRNNKNSY